MERRRLWIGTREDGRRPGRRLGLLGALALALVPQAAGATELCWTGLASNGDFNDPGNWTVKVTSGSCPTPQPPPNQPPPAPAPPGPDDVAEFSLNAGNFTVVVTAPIAVGQLRFSGVTASLSGAPITLSGVLEGTDLLLLRTAGSNVVVANDLAIESAGVIRTQISLGPTTLTLAGVLSAPPGVVVGLKPLVAANIDLTGANTYAGGTQVGPYVGTERPGLIRVADPSALGSGAVHFSSKGSLLLDTTTLDNDLDLGSTSVSVSQRSASTTLAGHISGGSASILNLAPDALAPPGARTVLTGDNSGHEGEVRLAAGATVNVRHPDALGSPSAVTALNHDSVLEVEGGIAVGEPVQLGDAATEGVALRSLGGANTWTGAMTGSRVLDLDVATGSLTVSGSFAVRRFHKTGAGTLLVTDVTAPNNKTELSVDAGTLLVDGALGGAAVLQVAAGATLGGTGTIKAGVLVDGSLLLPSGPPLHIEGDVTLSPSASFDVGIDGAQSGGLVIPGGVALRTVSLDGVLAPALVDVAPETSFVIVNADTGVEVTGTFSGLPEGASVSDLTISYAGGDGHDVVLTSPGVCAQPETEPPTLYDCPPGQTVECTGAGGTPVSFTPPAAVDNCDPNPTVTCMPAPGYAFPLGVTTVECSATDNLGNQTPPGACELEIAVADTTPPTLTCPADQTVSVLSGDAVSYAEPTAADTCSDPVVACSPASGSVLAFGSHAVTCTATDGAGLTASCGFALQVDNANQAPTAAAGDDQLWEYTTAPPALSLDGCGSTDDGLPGPLTFSWQQVAGAPAALSDPTACDPTVATPDVPPGTYEVLTFLLTVSDGELSAVDSVDLTLSNVNHAPTCNPPLSQQVAEGAPVVLDGSTSFDADGDPITASWQQLDGSPVLLGGSGAVVTFDAPFVTSGSEDLVFELTVSDGALSSSCTTVVTVENVNHCPAAEAGPGQTVSEGALVTLDGRASSDPDQDPLSYAWEQASGPSVTLAGGDTATPSFLAPAVGPVSAELVFSLIVDDGYGCFASDSVTITVSGSGGGPSCEGARPSGRVLWPPNHKLVAVGLVGVGTGDLPTAVAVVAVTQDEAVDGLGDGHTSPDAVLVGAGALLRAERAGDDGRVYHLHFTATNDAGACAGTVTVCVPRSLGFAAWLQPWREGGCVDGGELFDSTQGP